MKASEAVELVALLEGAYPYPLGDAAAVYELYLQDLDAARARAVVVGLIAECERRPTIAAIRSRYADIVTGVPSAEAAWAEVSRLMQSHPRTRTPEFSHPLIAKVVREVSWYTLCSSQNMAADRAAFRDRYRELRGEAVRTVQVDQLVGAPHVRGLLSRGDDT